MTKKDIALEYLRCFCSGDVEGLEPLLAPRLRFSGVFHSYQSASEYLAALRQDPPVQCGYRVLSITQSKDDVALFYEFEKSGGVTRLAQLFRIREGLIQETLLIFDARDLA